MNDFEPESSRINLAIRFSVADLNSKLHLHAYQIDLSCVMNKKYLVKAPLPDYFKQDLASLGFDFKEK